MQEVRDLVHGTMNKVEAAELDPIRALVELHTIQKELDALSKTIKDWKSEYYDRLEADAGEYPDGFGGFRFEFRSGGKTFNYKGIKEFDDAAAKVKEVQEKYKAAFMSLQKGIAPVDAETGEVLETPTVTYRSGSIVLREKK